MHHNNNTSEPAAAPCGHEAQQREAVHPICPHCTSTVTDEDAFCTACGAMQRQDVTDTMRSMRLHTRRVNMFRYAGVILLIVTIASLYVYASVRQDFRSGSVERLLVEGALITAVSLCWIYGLYAVLKVRSAVPCASCGERIPFRATGHHDFAFCPFCGTRIARGSGACDRVIRVVAEQGGTCAFCGSAVRSDQRYCSDCGANVGRTLCEVDELMASLSVAGSAMYVLTDRLRRGCLALIIYLALLPFGLMVLANLFRDRTLATEAVIVTFVSFWTYGAWRALVWNQKQVDAQVEICPACARDVYRMTGGAKNVNHCPACGWQVGGGKREG